MEAVAPGPGHLHPRLHLGARVHEVGVHSERFPPLTMTTTKNNVQFKGESLKDESKKRDVRTSNIVAAKAVSDSIRTSLGPRGMDKMIQKPDGDVIITNDGATILSQLQVLHPTARMLVELSKSQDIEAGDGTTSVCVIAGSFLSACEQLLEKGIHPTTIADSFKLAEKKAEEILHEMARPIHLNEHQTLVDAVNTCLSSKVIFQNAEIISPIAVDAVLSIVDPNRADNVDLRDIQIIKQVGGTVDDSELVHGLVFEQGAQKGPGSPTFVENAKIAMIQFHLAPPKTDQDSTIVVSDYAAMDRILREERKFLLGMCKKIQKTGCNVLLVQKAIVRLAYTDLALHFLAKMGIMVITDIERNDVEFICKTIGCLPIANVDHMSADKLGFAKVVEEVSMPGATHKVVKMTGVENSGRTTTILLRGSNKLTLDEAERSVHDALCVVRSLVKKKFLISGGSSAETEVSLRLTEWSKTLTGMASYCTKAYAEALEIIPYTLAENAGLNPIEVVTEIRKRHAEGEKGAGINVKDGNIANMYDMRVVQPLLVSLSALRLATETVIMILKIDDLIPIR